MSTKLHELLAVEQGLATTSNNTVKEAIKTLVNKPALFSGMVKSHSIFAEDQQHLVQATEHKEVQSTIAEQLDFVSAELAQYWNVTLQKEAANQHASADIVIGTTTIATNVPAIVLLGLEKKLTSLQALYNAIPTLDSAVTWEYDDTNALVGVYRTKHAIERQQTTTDIAFIEASPATPQHKAQLKEITETTVIGKYTTTNFSSAITSLAKSEKLRRLSTLIRAVKTARQRANNVDVNTELTIGSALLDYVNNG